MRKFVHKLRSRPEHERRQILFVSTIVLSLVAVFFWVSLFHIEYGDAKIGESFKTEFRPLASLKEGAVSLYKSMSASAGSATYKNSEPPVTKTDDGVYMLHPENSQDTNN